MTTQEELHPLQQPAPATLPLSQALRTLYRSALPIRHTAPYAAARLARIADQAEYFLQQWPDEQWPTYLHSSQPLPAKAVLLAWLGKVRQETVAYTAGTAPWPYASWRQASTTLLAALVPFT